jgi:hypothetical protein
MAVSASWRCLLPGGAMQPRVEWPEIGPDHLDAPIPEAQGGWLRRRRPALGARATAAPTLLFVLLGAALGPLGFNILTRTALSHLQGATWVALAVIGVFIGLGLAAVTAGSARRTIASSAIIALITIATVAVGLYLLAAQSGIPLPGNILAGSMLIGLCASVSAALQTTARSTAEVRHAARLADLDDVPLLVFGVAIVAALAGGSVWLRLLATAAAGGAIGLAGWLLFERADDSERGVFVTGAVLLLAGTGAFLGTSPLISGCLAALVWVRAPGAADRITARDLRTLQHPLVALMLIIAGATVEWSPVVLWVTAYVVVLRLAAKLLASVVVARLARVSPALLATVLLQPGVMGIALGLNVAQMLGDDYLWVLSAVTASAVVSEILGLFLPRIHEEPA